MASNDGSDDEGLVPGAAAAPPAAGECAVPDPLAGLVAGLELRRALALPSRSQLIGIAVAIWSPLPTGLVELGRVGQHDGCVVQAAWR